MKLRAWAEFITPKEVSDPAVVSLLKRYDVNPCVAVPYGSLDEDYATYLKAYCKEGLEPALWPTMSDELGYWPNERNVTEFFAYIREIYDWSEKEGTEIPWLAIDMEPPYYQWAEINKTEGNLNKTKKMLNIWRSNRNRERFDEAGQIFKVMQGYIREKGTRTIVPVVTFLEVDLQRRGFKLQDYFETPVSPVNWDVITFMQYNSMFTGESRGLIKPSEASYYLYKLCVNIKELLGPRASVSVGLTSTGKLENEPYYPNPEDLRPDIEAALAAGIDDIAIFSLEGCLNSANPESWFEMMRDAKPVVPKRSKKVDLLRGMVKGAYRLLP